MTVLAVATAPLPALQSAVVLAVGGLAALGAVWVPVRAWLPERACQVSTVPMRDEPSRAGFRWGVTLGTGLSTYVVTPAIYCLLVVTLGQTHPAGTLGACVFYGAFRGGVIAWFSCAHGRARTRRVPVPGAGLEATLRWPLCVVMIAATATAVS